MRRFITTCLAASLLAACSTTHYRESADREAYALIAEKTPNVPGMPEDFTIEPATAQALDELPTQNDVPDFLGNAASTEQGAKILSLEKALEIAVKTSRTYQNQKETVYLQALQLALERHEYAPIFSGRLAGDYVKSSRDSSDVSLVNEFAQQAPELVSQIGDLAGTPAALIQTYSELVRSGAAATGLDTPGTRIVDERNVEGSVSTGVDLLLKGGGRVAVDLTSNFLRYITGNPRVDTSSALVGTFTQPLLRGAGRKAAAERLTQAERDLLYTLRDFVRFRKEFTVEVCTDYYGLLQNRDTVRNNYATYLSFKRNTEREMAFAAEGLRTQAEVGRLQQAEFSAEDRWVASVSRYRQNLDRFRILLGLPTDAPIIPDSNELDVLKEHGIIHPRLAADEAVEVALTARLDLYTEKDQLDDAKRNVDVAANALKPGLDLIVQGNISSMPGDRFQELDTKRSTWSAGLDADLPLDRKSERNQYRTALIAHERACRDYDLAVDNVKLDVRDGWRSLDEAKRAYEIALQARELNTRRVDEQDMLAELGRATALDQVDAQNDLNDAENNLTAALVNHTIARLQFWRDMGILFIKEDGQWEEITDVDVPTP